MKSFVVVLALAAFASGAVIPKPSLRDGDTPESDILDLVDNTISNKKHHVSFVSGLGFVSHHSPVWAAVRDLDDEELAAFVAELHSLHGDVAETTVDDQEQESVDDAISRKHHVSFVSGMGFISHHSPMWIAVKDLDDEELAAFVAELNSLRGDVVEEAIADNQEQELVVEAISRKYHVSFVSGLGFVSHHSPVWAAVRDLDDEELAAFVAELHSLHGDGVAETTVDDQEQELVAEAISRKHHVSFVSGLGFVSHHSPMWIAVKDLDDEELAAFVAELNSLHGDVKEELIIDDQEQESVEDAISRKHHVSFVSGMGFVSHHSPMWIAVKDLDDEELAAFVAELNILHGDVVEDTIHVEEQELVNDAISRKLYVSFVSGLGFVNHNSPMWAAVKDLNDEELAAFVAELHSLHDDVVEEATVDEQEQEEIELPENVVENDETIESESDLAETQVESTEINVENEQIESNDEGDEISNEMNITGSNSEAVDQAEGYESESKEAIDDVVDVTESIEFSDVTADEVLAESIEINDD